MCVCKEDALSAATVVKQVSWCNQVESRLKKSFNYTFTAIHAVR